MKGFWPFQGMTIGPDGVNFSLKQWPTRRMKTSKRQPKFCLYTKRWKSRWLKQRTLNSRFKHLIIYFPPGVQIDGLYRNWRDRAPNRKKDTLPVEGQWHLDNYPGSQRAPAGHLWVSGIIEYHGRTSQDLRCPEAFPPPLWITDDPQNCLWIIKRIIWSTNPILFVNSKGLATKNYRKILASSSNSTFA